MADMIFHEEMLKDYSDVLTVGDLQEILHLGKNSVYRLLSDGEIKAFKAGRRYIIPKICVIDYLLKTE